LNFFFSTITNASNLRPVPVAVLAAKPERAPAVDAYVISSRIAVLILVLSFLQQSVTETALMMLMIMMLREGVVSQMLVVSNAS
jgi:hypothetical protein